MTCISVQFHACIQTMTKHFLFNLSAAPCGNSQRAPADMHISIIDATCTDGLSFLCYKTQVQADRGENCSQALMSAVDVAGTSTIPCLVLGLENNRSRLPSPPLY